MWYVTLLAKDVAYLLLAGKGLILANFNLWLSELQLPAIDRNYTLSLTSSKDAFAFSTKRHSS